MRLGIGRWATFGIALLFFVATFLYSESNYGPSFGPSIAAAQQTPSGLESNPTGGNVPGGSRGNNADGTIWSNIRNGTEGTVSILDDKAARLIQSEGQIWRNFRSGPLMKYGAWALLGIIALLAVFFLIRGRIKIEAGNSGTTITRFALIERIGHWTLASSFIILAISGLNTLYGRYVLLPILGPDAFGAISIWGKIAHNYVGFAFMVGLVMVFVMWVMNNLPTKTDVAWIFRGGGMFSKHSHPPARKFNAGQKILFWLVIVIGVSLSTTGISLMFPFEIALFAKTFAFLNFFGFELPTNLTVIQEMQFAQGWHAIQAIAMIVVIIAHIYIGSVGMEGAFDAVSSGEVDLNWAREHHSIWVEELEQAEKNAEPSGDIAKTPAE
ncbi:MAG: formate dehydrogenase subunit gamma [Rhizobiales bacterium]|nr:formate dehydrogenase subunit gamma [Hyphomicrobiales bacterium]